MRKLTPVAALTVLVVMVAFTGCSGTSASQSGGAQFEVMSPWGDADPIPLRGISPRIDTLEGKKIGIFANSKRSAMPQARMVERKLKEKFPTIETSIYNSLEFNIPVLETENAEKFTAWVQSVDAIVTLVGD